MPKSKQNKTKSINTENLEIAKEKFKEKFKVDVNSECPSCINNAINEEGYISDEEVNKIYKPYKEKKDQKRFLNSIHPK